MDFTGERWVFQEGGQDIIQREHLARYVFANAYVKDKRVLDIACGVGYGSYLLASQGQAKEVVGMDIDPDSIDYASTKYQHKGLSFAVGDAQKIPLESSSFDIVVSFETIEHLPDQKAYLEEISRVLKDGGYFIVSTPDKDFYQIYNLDKANKFHIKELTKAEFTDQLSAFFGNIKLFGQNVIDVPVWIKEAHKEKYRRLVRAVDVFDLRKLVKKHASGSGLDTQTQSSQGIYDQLDSTVKPLTDQPHVYLLVVCQKIAR